MKFNRFFGNNGATKKTAEYVSYGFVQQPTKKKSRIYVDVWEKFDTTI